MDSVKEVAKKEFEEEQKRVLIEVEKEKLRQRASFWRKIFPWRIWIRRVDTFNEKEYCAIAQRTEHVMRLEKVIEALEKELSYRGVNPQRITEEAYYARY